MQLSIFTGMPFTKINNWLDPDKSSVPKAAPLIIMAKYFNCTVDFLLDLANRRDSEVIKGYKKTKAIKTYIYL